MDPVSTPPLAPAADAAAPQPAAVPGPAPPDGAPRAVRRMVVFACAVLAVAAAATVARRLLERPDLATGKPWRASSRWDTCTPQRGKCGPLTSRILFHTNDDESPWFEIDLGAPTRMSGVTIVNRADDAPERARPLLVELSDDARSWREVARKDEVFGTWRPSFPSQVARYVRVRIPRKTWLHLEAVRVHE